MLKKLWNWLKPKITAIFTLTVANVAKSILKIINDPEIQTHALDSVKAAAENGFKGNEAFEAAFHSLRLKLQGLGIEAKKSVIETIIQNAYIAFKYDKN